MSHQNTAGEMNQTIDLFSKLYRQNFDKLQQRLSAKYPDLLDADCEDLVQQAWTELYTRITKRPDDVPEKMLGYVWQTAYNLASARYKDNCLFDHDTLNSAGGTADGASNGMSDLESLLGGEADSESLCLERLALLDMAMNELPPNHRALIEGFYYKHESMRDLSAKLSFKNEDVAKVIKGRVIKHLRDKMYELSLTTSLRFAA